MKLFGKTGDILFSNEDFKHIDSPPPHFPAELHLQKDNPFCDNDYCEIIVLAAVRHCTWVPCGRHAWFNTDKRFCYDIEVMNMRYS